MTSKAATAVLYIQRTAERNNTPSYDTTCQTPKMIKNEWAGNGLVTDMMLHDRLAAGVTGTCGACRHRVELDLRSGSSSAPGSPTHPPVARPAVMGCPAPGGYSGRELADLAALWRSENVFERAIGVAAVNAHWNRFDLEAEPARTGWTCCKMRDAGR